MPLIFQSRVPLACSLSFVVGVAFAVVSDVLSAPRFLLSFVVHAEFQVGVLTLEECRWKIVLGEELQPLVVLAIQRHLYGRLLVIHRS